MTSTRALTKVRREVVVIGGRVAGFHHALEGEPSDKYPTLAAA